MDKTAQAEGQSDLFLWASIGRQQPLPPEQPAPAPKAIDNLSALEDRALLLRLERGMELGDAIPVRVALIREAGRRRLAEAVPSLLAAIRLLSGFDRAKPAPEVAEAIQALQAIGSRAACAELVHLLERGEYSPATWAAVLDLHRALGCAPSADSLRRALELGDSRAVAAAARLAGVGRMSQYLGTLRALLNSAAVEVRLGAAIGLGLLGDRSVKALLEGALRQAGPALDGELLDALGRAGDRETLVLVRKLLDGAADEGDALALLGLAEDIGGPLARRLLGDIARSFRSERVRAAAAEMLATLTPAPAP